MKSCTLVLVLAAIVTFSNQGFGFQIASQPEIDEQLRTQLLYRMEIDQKARKNLVESMRLSTDGTPTQEVIEEMQAVDKANTDWLSNYLAQNRWPGKSVVGEDGAHAAWLIVQHSDHDQTFQRQCLALMRSADPGEVASVDIAYLTDRVLVRSGKKQKYGTQVGMIEGRFELAPVEDPDNLNARRAALGLQSIESYMETIRQNYAQSNTRQAFR